jgi:hypothetical protein
MNISYPFKGMKLLLVLVLRTMKRINKEMKNPCKKMIKKAKIKDEAQPGVAAIAKNLR